MLLVCYNLLNSQNIPINQYPNWKIVGYKDTSNVDKKAAEVAQKKRAITGPWGVSSIMEVR